MGDEVASIENHSLSVKWDSQAGLSLGLVPCGREIVAGGKLRQSGGTAHTIRVPGQIFDEAQALQIKCADGGQEELLLVKDVPFVLIRFSVHNRVKEPATLRRVPALRATLDLGKPAESLKVLGTGGLAAPADKPGSYMWMAVADPQPRRRGVVAGWFSTERCTGTPQRRSRNR